MAGSDTEFKFRLEAKPRRAASWTVTVLRQLEPTSRPQRLNLDLGVSDGSIDQRLPHRTVLYERSKLKRSNTSLVVELGSWNWVFQS